MRRELFITSSSGGLNEKRYSKILKTIKTFLELVRYIHLNPIRAGMVKDLKALNSYSRSDHSVIMGRVKHNLTPSTVSKLVSRGRLETKTSEIAKELPEVK